VENVMEDKDFRLRFTREQFDVLMTDLFARVAKPVQDALKMAELSPV
jgi:molecular chaperone DnaK (HSP70)